eukprot:UN03307
MQLLQARNDENQFQRTPIQLLKVCLTRISFQIVLALVKKVLRKFFMALFMFGKMFSIFFILKYFSL